MKKLLLATGVIYGIYMLLKQSNNTNKFATVDTNFDEEPIANGFKKNNSKAKEHHHSDIRKWMKKASVKSHHVA